MKRFLIAMQNAWFQFRMTMWPLPLIKATYVDRYISLEDCFQEEMSWCPSCKVNTPEVCHKGKLLCVYCTAVKHQMAL